MKITRAVIAAAGFGTRFLPATKVIPKEMLPLVDRPIIQALVEEAVRSGIKEVILVIRPGNPLIRQHFGLQTDLGEHLKKQAKQEFLKELQKMSRMAKFIFVEQDKNLPYGTGSPVLSAKKYLKKGEFFVLMYGDDLVKAEIPVTKQLIDFWVKRPTSAVLAVQEIPRSQVNRYGIIKLKSGSANQMEYIVEKPKVEEAPSCLASLGRFILNWEILKILEEQRDNLQNGKEFYLTDAITTYAQKKPVLVMAIKGQWLTTGDPLNWLKANIEFALEKKEIKQELAHFLKDLELS